MQHDRIIQFTQLVWDYYHDHGRHDLPWRSPNKAGYLDPYHILVSEIMLQQTQVSRVIPKYQDFLLQFPSLASLAQANLGSVLKAWSGLGYNRRAKFLQQAAQHTMADHNGSLPTDLAQLQKLPGIGPNTAGAIAAYAYNQPTVFIETNIRSAFIHHFFNDQDRVSDKQLVELVAASLDTKNPREWYWALMDYGSHIKQHYPNPSRRSSMYTKQSAFHGSKRQLRGRVIRLLAERQYTVAELQEQLADERASAVIEDLMQEGLIQMSRQKLSL